MNQSNANVSVVRLGQSDGDPANGDITLTVDPPPAANNSQMELNATNNTVASGNVVATDAASLVDPFMEMDPEQLERLENALQSEQAKQILGENVAAMLGKFNNNKKIFTLLNSYKNEYFFVCCCV